MVTALSPLVKQNTFESFDTFKEFVRNTFINGSGIDPDLFDACIEFHESQEYDYGGDVATPIHEELDWKFTRFTQQVKEQFYAAFFKNEDGTTWQAIVGLWDDKKQRPYRYLAPKGIGDRAYLPPVPAKIRKRIGSKYGVDIPLVGSFWKWLENQDKLPRIITEGGKKSLCGLSDGYIAIALYGCKCGAIGEDEDGEKITPRPISDLARFATENTIWLFAFDRDEKDSAKTAVSFGKKRLMGSLVREGRCFCEDVFWTPQQGKGWDDLVTTSGSGAFDNAYSRALSRLEKQFKTQGSIIEDIETGKKPSADRMTQQLSENYRHVLKFNDEKAQWMRYEADYPGVWSPETDHFVESLVYGIVINLGIQGYSSNYIVSIARLLKHQLTVRKWEEKSNLLPFTNGVLDLSTGRLEPHSPGYRLTWQLPREYTEDATDWSHIDKFLDHLSGNKPKIKDLLLCYCNAVIKGRSDLQKFLHLIGIGGAGKGSFSRLVMKLVGEQNVLVTTLEDWCTNRFEGANAYGKRLVLFPDEDKQTGKLGKFLSLTGEDFIRAEEKGKKAFQFRYQGMAMVLSNFPIFSGDSANRIKRRAITIPCNNPVNSINRRLEADFDSQLTAFTNYVINIPDDRVTEVLTGIGKIDECTLEFWENRTQVDSIAAWLNQHIIFDATAETQVGCDKNEGEDNSAKCMTLFGSYNKHCRAVGDAAKSHKRFSPELLELCRSVLGWPIERRVTNTGKFIRGLRLRRAGQDDEIPTYDYFLIQKTSMDVRAEPIFESDGSISSSNDRSNDGSNPLPDKDFNGNSDSTPASIEIFSNKNLEITQNPTASVPPSTEQVIIDALKQPSSPTLVKAIYASPLGEVKAIALFVDNLWQLRLFLPDGTTEQTTSELKGEKHIPTRLKKFFKSWVNSLRFKVQQMGEESYYWVEGCKSVEIPIPHAHKLFFVFETPAGDRIRVRGEDEFEVMP
jgi:putative DNA primase/helicase